MKVNELINKVKEADPYLLGNKPQEKMAANLLRTAFAVIRKEIEETDSGIVAIAGLGRFNVKNVERKNKEGEPETRRAITFVAQKRKDKSDILPSQ